MERSTDNQVQQLAKENEPIIYKKESSSNSLWTLWEKYNETPKCFINLDIFYKSIKTDQETENDRFYHNEMD